MYQAFFSQSGDGLLNLPIFSMILFALTFTAVVVWVWRRGPDDPEHQRLANLPLDAAASDDDIEGKRPNLHTPLAGGENG
jgi:hypothetical protein